MNELNGACIVPIKWVTKDEAKEMFNHSGMSTDEDLIRRKDLHKEMDKAKELLKKVNEEMALHTTLAEETLYCDETLEPASDDENTRLQNINDWPNQPFGD